MNISAYRADYLPLIGQLMNQMRLPQIINEAMAIPNSQAIVDAGTMIEGGSRQLDIIIGRSNVIVYANSNKVILSNRLSHFF